MHISGVVLGKNDIDTGRQQRLWNIFRERSPQLAAAVNGGSANFSRLLPWDPMPNCLKCDNNPRGGDNTLQGALIVKARLDTLKLRNEKTNFLASNPDLCYVLEQLAISAYRCLLFSLSSPIFSSLFFD